LDKDPSKSQSPSDDNVSAIDYDSLIKDEQPDELNVAVSNETENIKQVSGSSEIYDWMQSLVSALLICVLVFAFFIRIIGIIGSSMVPTFHDKDSVIISNLFYEPKQGDVIVLRKLAFEEEPIIKRVIAVAGQTVNIDFTAGIVYVDGKALDEPYIAEPTHNALDFDGEITVPDNCVFVMGDNRNNSTDSRRSVIGCVDERYILGKVLVRILPLNKFGVVN
jgi:signal peptidase I